VREGDEESEEDGEGEFGVHESPSYCARVFEAEMIVGKRLFYTQMSCGPARTARVRS